jgi:hypothetical protein
VPAVGKDRLPAPDTTRDKAKRTPPRTGGDKRNSARLAIADERSVATPWMPSPDAKSASEQATPGKLGAKPEAMQTMTASGADLDDTGAQRFWYRDATGVAGDRGTISSRANLELVVADEPRSGLAYPQEIKAPPKRVQLYPVQIWYSREIDFLDKAGNVIHVTVTTSLGMDRDHFDKQLGLGTAPPTFDQLRDLVADNGDASLYVEGLGADGTPYFGTMDVEGADASMRMLQSQLDLKISAPSGLLAIVGRQLVNPRAATWEQFEEIVRFVDATNQASREQYAIDHPKTHHGPIGRFFLAAGGAIVSLGEGFEQAVLNIADAGRLLVAIAGNKTGLYDYTPTMWGDVGKASEANPKLTSGDVAKGMVKGIAALPKHAIEELENDDPYQFGKDAMNMYMFARGGYETAKGVGGLAFNFGVRGLSKLGPRGLALAYDIRSWQAARAFARSTRDIKFPEGMKPTIDYDPHLKTEAQYNPNTNTLTVGEKAFTPRWRSFFPRPGGGKIPSLRGRVGMALRGGFLDMAVRHETWHAFQHLFDPTNPNWSMSSTTPYLQNSLEFTQPGAKYPGAWDKMLGAPAGPFARGIGSLVMAPAMFDAPQASEEQQTAALQLLAHAQHVTTADELAKLGDLPIIAVIAGDGRLLLGDNVLEAGAWILIGDDKKQYVVPTYLLGADR